MYRRSDLFVIISTTQKVNNITCLWLLLLLVGIDRFYYQCTREIIFDYFRNCKIMSPKHYHNFSHIFSIVKKKLIRFKLDSLNSWYSWTLNSLVNGVYAFGFLFMLPQLFVNYKLKSVAALPWRAFMYKAFNTFIDDIFAFIITMPTAHRLACFRDDIVLLIYLVRKLMTFPIGINIPTEIEIFN